MQYLEVYFFDPATPLHLNFSKFTVIYAIKFKCKQSIKLFISNNIISFWINVLQLTIQICARLYHFQFKMDQLNLEIVIRKTSFLIISNRLFTKIIVQTKKVPINFKMIARNKIKISKIMNSSLIKAQCNFNDYEKNLLLIHYLI